MIKNAGFIVQEAKKVKVSPKLSEGLQSIQPDFVPLSDFVFEDECMVAILEKDNAIKDFLSLIGNRNPAKAKIGTIRALFGDSHFFDLLQSEIIVHGSKTPENAKLEIEFFYECEKVSYPVR